MSSLNMFLWGWITKQEKALLLDIVQGGTLKSHRDIDGNKRYVLYKREDGQQEVSYHLVQSLLRKNLITTNQKFPAATFLVTTKGQKRLGLDPSDLKGISSVVQFDSENSDDGLTE